jgi:hypothetical protein
VAFGIGHARKETLFFRAWPLMFSQAARRPGYIDGPAPASFGPPKWGSGVSALEPPFAESSLS